MTRQSNVSSQRAEGGRKLPQAATQGLVRVSAGELLGRTHEELVLLLIQLRRQNATIYKAMENCHMEIEAQVRRHFQKQNRWPNGSSCDWEQRSLRQPMASWRCHFSLSDVAIGFLLQNEEPFSRKIVLAEGDFSRYAIKSEFGNIIRRINRRKKLLRFEQHSRKRFSLLF